MVKLLTHSVKYVMMIMCFSFHQHPANTLIFFLHWGWNTNWLLRAACLTWGKFDSIFFGSFFPPSHTLYCFICTSYANNTYIYSLSTAEIDNSIIYLMHYWRCKKTSLFRLYVMILPKKMDRENVKSKYVFEQNTFKKVF